MAEPVYDEDELDSLNPAELRNLEQKHSTPLDEAEDNAIEDGSDPETMTRGGTGRKLREHSEKKDAKEQEALNERVRGGWSKAKKADEESGKGWYTGGKSKTPQKGLFKRWGKKRTYAIIAGGAVGSIVGVAMLLFSFLNIYKLDGLISNIDDKTFARLNGSLDQRSSKYISAYMKLRLADIGDDPKNIDTDNIFFRSNKVDTNNPITDWYKTLRTSKFENEVFNQHGIKFVSFAYRDGNQIKFRAAKINVDGKDILDRELTPDLQNEIKTAVSTGDWTKFNSDNFGVWNSHVDQVFENDKEARREIKRVVNDNTHFYQVFQRRHLRKSIQNMTGVRDWRFFENTRNKVDEKKINIRNKLVTKAIPESTISGKFVRCLFGITECRFSEDPSDPQYRSESELDGEGNRDNQGDPLKESDPNIPAKAVDMGPATEVIKKVIANAAPPLEALNVISTMDSISRVDKALTNHQLSKGVSVARGIQAEGFYQVIKTSRDQAKSGEVNGDEYNQLMQVLGPIAMSEGWTKVIDGQGDPSKLTDTKESRKYCSEENQAAIENDPAKGNQQFANLCANKQVGGSSNSATLEDAYNKTIGRTLHPIVEQYSRVRNAPVVGQVLDFINAIFDKVSGLVVSLLQVQLKLLGLNDNLQDAMKWMINKLTAFMGAGPILNGNESAGVLVNWLVQGGAYTAEATARYMGAAITTPASKLVSEQATIAYQQDQEANMSSFDKYLSLSNPDSPAAKTTLAVSQMNMQSVSSKLTNFGSIFKTIGSAFVAPFSSKASAGKDHSYDGTQFAGIVTFDINPFCYQLDPISNTPKEVTNIQQVLGKDKVPDSDLTWDLVKNGYDWYKYIYDKLGDREDADQVAMSIYNCQLEGNAVMGSMGANYGYTDDGGLNDSSSDNTTADAPTVNTTGGAAEIAHKIQDAADAGHIKFNLLNPADDGDGSSPEKNIKEAADGQESNTSTRCTANAPPNKSAPLDLNLLKFILELSQATDIEINELTGGCHSSSNSNHYQGTAVDFDCPFDSEKADKIGKKYNISDQTGETCSTSPPHYHYSIGGN
jgi:hypothetical protein